MNIPTKQKITIMLLGPSGAGKSRTGNNLLGDKVFSVGSGGTPVTNKCRSETGERFGYRLHVIDTPGIWGEKHENEKLLAEIKKGLKKSNEGVHVFLLVLKMERAVDVHKISLRCRCLFGDKMFKYVILLFTNLDIWKDRFEYDNNGQVPYEHQYITSLQQDAINLLNECGSKYVLFDNKCTGNEMEKQLRHLMSTITEKIALNIDEVYTEDILQRIDDKTYEEPPRQGWGIPVAIVAGVSVIAGFIKYKCL